MIVGLFVALILSANVGYVEGIKAQCDKPVQYAQECAAPRR